MFAVLAIALGVAQVAPAETECLISPGAISQPVPRFASFPARIEKLGPPAPVDIRSNREARTYRTVLRDGAGEGPNFAGHFALVGWGCGARCEQWAVIDEKSGKVHFEPSIEIIDATNVDPDAPLEFRRDSRLLIAMGAPHENEARDGVGFYEWTGKSFKLLKFIPRAKACRDR